jgi:hypothetical protein
MADGAGKFQEIDLSKPARALRFLRYMDYLFVYVFGLMLLNALVSFVIDPSLVAFLFILSLFLIVYTGWRHVGVIDPRVWRSYLLIFVVVIPLSLVLGVLGLAQMVTESSANIGPQDFIGLYLMFLLFFGCLLALVSVWRLRRLRLEPPNIKLVDLLIWLIGQRGKPVEDTAKIKRINTPRGILLGVLAGLILVVGSFVQMRSDAQVNTNVLRMIQYAYMLAFFLLIRARRYFQVNADSLLAVDQRPPILFLRSFADDEKVIFTSSEKAFLDFSLETRLSNHFYYFGPFIAIGSPQEKLPEPGAARVLLSDSDWQPRVLQWMYQASLILMYSGKTHWVNWELSQVIAAQRVPNLILMIPEIKGWRRSVRARDVAARLELLKADFADTKWHPAFQTIQDVPEVRALSFHPDGSITLITSRTRNRDSYHLAALVAHYLILQAAATVDAKVTVQPSALAAEPAQDLSGPSPIEATPEMKPFFLCPACGEKLFTRVSYQECPACKSPINNICLKCGATDVHRAYVENGGWGDWCPHCKESLQRMRGEI